ncbi:MAG: TVP38/TMEM64 family protein [Proteobacteria bacterium]|nr:TVP38/TMEM64 family protein [Pseudomonadota bacterium]
MKQATINKIIIVVAILLLILLFKILHLDQYLTLSYLKESREQFSLLYAERTGLVIAGYMLIYIVATALSLPGAVILTLAGGALFGLVTGTIVISFASTIGATLACMVSRFLLRDWVQARFGEKLERINEGIEQEGGFYLFTLRLIPVFPFFVINLAMGLTRIKLSTYYWVSQLGMLPGTLVYVNAGKELGKLETLAGILSPSLIFSFVLLGLFPITVKKIVGRIKRKE